MQKKQNGSSVIQFLKDYKLSSVYCIYFIAILASFSPVREAHARKDTIETEYESREYKMLLDASRFSKDTDKAAEVYLETQLKPLMSALHKPIAVKGSFSLKKTVQFDSLIPPHANLRETGTSYENVRIQKVQMNLF